MKETNVARVHRYHAALNAIDLVAVEAMLAEDAEYHSPSVGAIVGKAAIVAAMAAYFAEYPDQHAVDDVVEEVAADKVSSRWRLRATAKTTGHLYERHGGEVITFRPDGLILRVEVVDT
jgi:ketosteroid isomerase-like protein